jgi:NADH:ubiquinone oxidoreductase subunit 2 (subunit N)
MDRMNFIAALPEILLLVAACMVLLADVLRGEDERLRIDRLALGALLFPAVATVWQIGQPAQHAFGGMYVADTLGHVLKLAAYGAVAPRSSTPVAMRPTAGCTAASCTRWRCSPCSGRW